MENQNKQGTLAGKKVILLGGSSGFGLATAKAAAAAGAQVVIVSSNQLRVNEALQQLPAGSQGHAIDLGQETNIQAFFEQAGAFDHLVYTAAENLRLHNLSDTDLATARNFFNLRYWSALAAVKYATPHIQPGGSINLSSGIAGQRPGKGWVIAASICSAMEGLVRALAVELTPIRVNSVVPGVVKTNLWNSMPDADRESLYKNVGDSLLVKRVGEAEEIAQAFMYLMLQQFGTGQNIVIDGGAALV